MSILELAADPRVAMGRKVKALRRSGLVPANVVSKGKDSIALQLDYNTLEKALNAVGYTQPVELAVDKDKITVLVTNVTLVPARNTIEHVTFQEVKKGELVTANVPIRMIGDAPGVTQGLLLLQVEDTVEIECGALSIPEFLEADVSGLNEDGDGIRAKDLKLPDNAELKTDPDATLVRLEEPRVVEEEPEEVEEVEGAEGETAEGEAAEGDNAESSDEG